MYQLLMRIKKDLAGFIVKVYSLFFIEAPVEILTNIQSYIEALEELKEILNTHSLKYIMDKRNYKLFILSNDVIICEFQVYQDSYSKTEYLIDVKNHKV